MTFTKLAIDGLVVIEPKVFGDSRGFFMESYNKKLFQENGIDIDFVQDNHSRSAKDVLRGLHFQLPPFAQDKLVRVIKGEVLDVAVDIRKDSPSYGKWESVKLSEENKKMFLVPKGFAHGFLVLSESADFEYKVSNYYSPEHDRGLRWNDTDINVEWGISNPQLSEKDANQPFFKDLKDTF
ncbi:dTDP-4-dehydrorhamnose 3,5-epimerase [Candidatus Dojkabacteria bacterium]|uniref:dTDP-4-dehydrorhamnose 3,5-epimerase n=1 Tax=Candidatus Dojkabacteria bacterium TaxID=2099670 RepID=A0A955RIW0_9BACT|nr:dTDP-4-dehydrorhamnose 3,5-epimerase [Candidatus Dojkabacteria bacterium]